MSEINFMDLASVVMESSVLYRRAGDDPEEISKAVGAVVRKIWTVAAPIVPDGMREQALALRDAIEDYSGNDGEQEAAARISQELRATAAGLTEWLSEEVAGTITRLTLCKMATLLERLILVSPSARASQPPAPVGGPSLPDSTPGESGS